MKKTSKNEVALGSQFTKEKVPAMLDQINEKIKDLKGGSDKKPSTVGKVLPGFDSTIANITDLTTLISAAASISVRKEGYEKAIKDLGIKTKAPKFTLEGVESEKWIEDIKLRYQEVEFKSQLDQLEEAKTILERNLSKDQQFANDMAKFTDLIKV